MAMPQISTKKSAKKKPQHKINTNPSKVKQSKPSASKEVSHSKSSGEKVEKRKVIYPEPEVRLCVGEDALTAEGAKEILGWEEVSDKVPGVAQFNDTQGAKIRCKNNFRNRYLTMGTVQMLVQEILRKQFRFNGQTIGIGQTGLMINGQHRLIALIFADQLWEKGGHKFADNWKTRPTIDTILVCGIEETDDVINTIDTGKQRTLDEVIYRSEYFAKIKPSDRKPMAKIADHAVRYLWIRTATQLEGVRKTHSESLDFIERHKRLLKCVKHIYEEDGSDGRIKSLTKSLGTAAGLMYLMAVCCTEAEEEGGYIPAGVHGCEDHMDFSTYDDAEEFWTLLAANDKSLKAVREYLIDLQQETNDNVSVRERAGIIIKAWNAWSANKKVTTEVVQLEYTKDGDGIMQLTDNPSVGGIDTGSLK